jgi:hypothetical protein
MKNEQSWYNYGKPMLNQKLCEFNRCRNLVLLESRFCQECITKSSYTTNDKKYNQLNKLKVNARKMVNWAIKTGRIQRKSCEIKDCAEIGQGHHPDYTKPLELVWLCIQHHSEHHQLLKDL